MDCVHRKNEVLIHAFPPEY